MAVAINKTQCFACSTVKSTHPCKECSKDFYHHDLPQQRQILIDRIENNCDQLRQSISEQKQKQKRQTARLMKQINEWERNSIEKIKQTAEQCRHKLIKLINQSMKKSENKFDEFIKQFQELRKETDYTEMDSNHLKRKLTKLTIEFHQLSNLSIEETSSSKFINKIFIILKEQFKWKHDPITVVGGNGQGEQLNQFYRPCGISIDDNGTIYIADFDNHRILQWKSGEKEGKIIAGGNGRGNRIDQLTFPTDVFVDKQNNCLIIADGGNRRVIRCSIQNPINREILISNIDCFGLTMDKNRSIYVSDCVKNEVTRWEEGKNRGGL